MPLSVEAKIVMLPYFFVIVKKAKEMGMHKYRLYMGVGGGGGGGGTELVKYIADLTNRFRNRATAITNHVCSHDLNFCYYVTACVDHMQTIVLL